VVLDFGRVIAEGSTVEVLESPVVASAYLGDDLLAEAEAGAEIEAGILSSESEEATSER